MCCCFEEEFSSKMPFPTIECWTNKIGVRQLFHYLRERPGGLVMAWDFVK